MLEYVQWYPYYSVTNWEWPRKAWSHCSGRLSSGSWDSQSASWGSFSCKRSERHTARAATVSGHGGISYNSGGKKSQVFSLTIILSCWVALWRRIPIRICLIYKTNQRKEVCFYTWTSSVSPSLQGQWEGLLISHLSCESLGHFLQILPLLCKCVYFSRSDSNPLLICPLSPLLTLIISTSVPK